MHTHSAMQATMQTSHLVSVYLYCGVGIGFLRDLPDLTRFYI